MALATVAAVLANGLAAGIVVTLLIVVLPTPDIARELVGINLALTGGYLLLALVTGVFSGLGRTRTRLTWLLEGRDPSPGERKGTIGIAFAVARVNVGLWLLAAVVFGIVNGLQSVLLGFEVVLAVIIGGLVSSTSVYLLVERVNRPLIARALQDAPLQQQRGTGVAWRTMLSWTLGTALPVLGLVLLNGLAIGLDIPRVRLAVASLVLGLIAVVFGFVIMWIAARSIAHPLKTLRGAMQELQDGNISAQIPVTDAGEVGILQTGFNQMVAGLAERDRIRDLFGRHVGREVARRALDEGVALGGEVRDVAVMFVDVKGSTGLAEREDPVTVIDGLNHLFAAVLAEVEMTQGTVTTFAGDAVVCVWGAPLRHDHAAESALLTSRRLAERLAADPDSLPVGIGVARGPVVAGNIGTEQRVEYTVIGDSVNTAARLCDLAKTRGTMLVATADTLSGVAAEEAEHWRQDGEETLPGRSTPTRLAVPVD